MPLVTIASFTAFANLVVAGCKLAATRSPADFLKSLAEIATGAKSLDAALGTTGLAAVAAEMARTAEDHTRHFTHPGPARDDAIALFWQVAPAAFADPATFAAAHLDPALTTDRMVAAIKASPTGRDFTATPLAEALFRAVAAATLQVMLNRADTVAALAPALWRQSLATTAAIKDDTAEILALVRELREIKQTTVPEITLIAMARKIAPRVADRDEALRALDAAADLAAEAQARGEAGSNVDTFVDRTLRRLAALTAEGRLDQAAAEAERAVTQAEAGLAQLLDAAVDQHLIAGDAEGAARLVARRLTLATPDPAGLFDALRREWSRWFGRGRDNGLRLDLEVAIALSRTAGSWARDAEQRGAALNALGTVLAILGERESGATRLEEAVDTYRAALGEWTRERTPLGWAATQNNLGNALAMLGARETGTERLEAAVEAYRAALEERTRERAPLEWAATQSNLGNALRALGERVGGTGRLEEAVAAYRAALAERTRERAPLEWATTQNNLGSALKTLGERTGEPDPLQAAVEAFRAALQEWTRKRVPLDWAMIQNNLGGAFAILGERERGTARLEDAVAAYNAALGEWTRERVPLGWATVQNNLGNVLRELGERDEGTARLEAAVEAFQAALEERPREQLPLDWAKTTGNLGIALRILGERTRDAATAGRALDTIAAAEATLRAAGHAKADYYAGQIPAAEALVARLSEPRINT